MILFLLGALFVISIPYYMFKDDREFYEQEELVCDPDEELKIIYKE